jgi:glycosyltransferase involved in cell wall biosynthesis
VASILREELTTVIVPTYQGSTFLGEALESIAKCASGEIEVLVVDDGSTDETVGIAQSFESRLPLRVILPGRRGNWMTMTNIGISEAKGKQCTILHQDDTWLPDRAHLLAQPRPEKWSMILMEAAFIDVRGRIIGQYRFPRAVRKQPHGSGEAPVAAALYVQNWLAMTSVVFDTTLARECGGLDETLWQTADWDLWLKLAHKAPAVFLEGLGGAFRIHSTSQTVAASRNLNYYREQLTTVQARHTWASDTHGKPALVRRAGALSTNTNLVLAAAFNCRPRGYFTWLRSLVAAGPNGVHTYITHSSIADRLAPRVRLAIGGALHRN